MKQKKSTKKFVKNHLKSTIQKRRTQQTKKRIVKPTKQVEHFEKPRFEDDDLEIENSQDEESDSSSGLDSESEEDTPTTLKQQLNQLKEKDPEFHKYLEEHDKSLLEFEGESDEESEDSGDEMSASEDGASEDSAAEESDAPKDRMQVEKTPKETAPLTLAQIQTWSNQLDQFSLKSTKKIILALKATLGDQVMDANIFNSILLHSIKVIPVFVHHLPKKPLDQNEKFGKLRPMIKSYLSSFQTLIPLIQDDNLLNLVLRKARELVPVLEAFPKLVKKLLPTLTTIIADKQDKTRILTVLFLSDLAGHKDGKASQYFVPILKALISTYKATPWNPHSRAAHEFLKMSIVQLSILSPQDTYMVTFQQLREIALKIRSKQDLISWNHLKQLELWADVVGMGMTREDGNLKMLNYPLIQITLASFKNAGDLVPYNMHLVEILLSLVPHVFIPLANQFIDLFSKVAATKPGQKPSKKTALPFLIKANNLHAYQTEILNHLTSLATKYFALLSTNPSFPELVIPFVYHLKKIKNKAFSTLLDKIKETSIFISKKRNGQSPLNPELLLSQDDTPLGKYYNNLKTVQQKIVDIQEDRGEEVATKKRKAEKVPEKVNKVKKVRVEEDGDEEDKVAEFDLSKWK